MLLRVIVHELLGDVQQDHNGVLQTLLDLFIPHWGLNRAELSDLPLPCYPLPD